MASGVERLDAVEWEHSPVEPDRAFHVDPLERDFEELALPDSPREAGGAPRRGEMRRMDRCQMQRVVPEHVEDRDAEIEELRPPVVLPPLRLVQAAVDVQQVVERVQRVAPDARRTGVVEERHRGTPCP